MPHNQYTRRDSLQTWLLSEAYRILTRMQWADWPDETYQTFCNHGRHGVRIIIGPSGMHPEQLERSSINIVTPPTFSPLELDILKVMLSTPQPGKTLAKRADREPGSHFRQALADLCRKGIVVHGPDGYRWG